MKVRKDVIEEHISPVQVEKNNMVKGLGATAAHTAPLETQNTIPAEENGTEPTEKVGLTSSVQPCI